MKTTTLIITGMTCQMCVKHVTRALEDLKGVSEVQVELEPGTAVVTYDSNTVGMQAFENAVSEAGYQITGSA